MATKSRRRPRTGVDRSPGLDRKTVYWILAIVIVAAAVRFGYIAEVRGHPLMTTATGDPLEYDHRALEILSGKWIGDDASFHSSPAYPYFLALVYAVFGHSYTAVRIIQSLIGIGSCTLIFFITRKLIGSPQAIISGLIAALYAPSVYFDSELLMISLVVFASLSALALLLTYSERGHAWLSLAAGACLGFGALGKPNLLLFLPAAIFWIWWSAGRLGRPRRAGRAAALLACGTAIMIAPITIQNYVVAQDFVLTSSNGGINFFIGNNEEALGTFRIDYSMRADLYGGSKRYAERALGRELRPSEVSSFWFHKGLEFIRNNPGRELWLLGRKFLLFWNAFEIPNHYNFYFFRRISNLLRLDPVLFAWVVPFGFLGIFVLRSAWRKHLLLYLFAAAYLVSLLPFFVTSRYRLPVVPVMMIFAGHGLYWLWGKLVAKNRRGLAAPLVVLALALVVVNLPIVDVSFAHQYAILGAVYRDRGDYAQAAEQFRRAVEADPEFDLAYLNLGSVLGRLGMYDEAEQALKKALSLNAASARAKSNLELLYLETGRYDEAKRLLLAATREDPELKNAWDSLARAAIVTGDGALAVTALENSLRLAPRDANSHWNLALVYAQDPTRRSESIEHARLAASLDPSLRGPAADLIAALEGRSSQEGRDTATD